MRIGQIATVTSLEPRRASSVGSTHNSEMFRGLARLPGYARTVPVFFKVFDPGVQSKALFNEILGYQVARGRGLPVAPDALVCACARSLIPLPSKVITARPASLSPYIAGLGSVDANPRSASQTTRYGFTPQLVSELQSWEYLPEVAALDELLVNTDRHYQNLHRIAKGKFLVIDHEAVFGGPTWTLEGLRRQLQAPSPGNHIADFIAQHTGAEIQNRMMQAGLEWRTLDFSAKELDIVPRQLDSLLQLEPGTTEDIIGLLNARCARLPELLFHHIRAFQLFQ